MSKNKFISQKELNELERQISEQLKVSEHELEQSMKESQELLSEHEHNMERFQGIFNDSEGDKLVEEELRRLENEMGVSRNTQEQEFRELEEQIESMPDITTDNEDLEIQQLLDEIDSRQTEAVVDRGEDVSTLLKMHSEIANRTIENSSNPEEIEQLTSFSKGAKDLSGNIDNALSRKTKDLSGKESKENGNRFMSAISAGVKKLYGGLKSGTSSAIDNIKKLGKQIGKAITSLFDKTPKKQNLEFSKAINETRKEVENRSTNKEGISEAKAILKKRFINLERAVGFIKKLQYDTIRL